MPKQSLLLRGDTGDKGKEFSREKQLARYTELAMLGRSEWSPQREQQ